VAKNALPMAGAALGNMVLPGIGGAIGGNLAQAAGSMFGLEVEGLSSEDQEYEVAKQVVRLGADATKNAVMARPGPNPAVVARKAMVQSAQKFAPGLVSGAASVRRSNGPAGGAKWGRWAMRGNDLVVYGAK
jgi:hypothetical protein